MIFHVVIIAQHGTRLAVMARDSHMSLRGITAASAILRLLRILSYPSNRTALKQELSFSSSLKQGDPGTDYMENVAKGRPPAFPFIQTCLHLGLRGAVCDSLESKRLCMLARVGVWAHLGDIRLKNRPSDWSRLCDTAVVDITDLDRPKYCFAANDCKTEDVMAYIDRFSTDTIAGQKNLEAECVVRALSKFECIGSIPVMPGRLPFFSFVSQVESRGGLSHKSTLKSLLDLCTAKILDGLLSSGEDHDLSFLDEVLGMPHVATFIWKYCLENVNRLVKGSDTLSLKILTMAFKGKTSVNLAPFRNLKPATVRALLRSLPEARIINLSGTVAMTDGEITNTLAAIDHDLDALYLLTPPNHHQHGERPEIALYALRNWGHKCCKVLISSVLADEPKKGIPCWVSPEGSVYPQFETRRPYISSESFPVTQIIYRSTYNCPVLAYFFIGGGLVAPYRLLAGIMKTIKGVHFNHAWNDYNLGSSLVNSLALGPSTPDSDEYLDVRSIPAEACFLSQQAENRRVYSNPASRMRGMVPDAWTAVLLRDEVSTEASSPKTGAKVRRTSRFRIVLLRPKYAIPVEENQIISVDEFEFMALPTLLHQQSSSEADDLQTKVMEVYGPDRTEIQFQVGPLDTVAAITAVQKVLDAATALYKRQSRLKLSHP